MIFVSYSWIDKEPNMEVLNFVAYLRTKGYEATCDIMFMEEETAISFPKMMAKSNITYDNEKNATMRKKMPPYL